MDTSSWPEAMLLDDLLDGYVDWRASARAVAESVRAMVLRVRTGACPTVRGIHRDARPGAEDGLGIC